MRNARPASLALACIALLFAGQAAATSPTYQPFAQQASPSALDRALERLDSPGHDADGLLLKPGEFQWLQNADANSDSPVTFLVSISEQRGYLYRDGERIAVTTVSTGKPGHDTPWGVFPISEKKKTHFSNRYNNAPMPYMQRLTRWGHALHAGQVRAGPASHGCVRLPAAFAQQLFSLTKRGDLVVIANDASMVSMERAGVDSRIAQLVGSSSRLQRAPESMLTQGDSSPAAEAGAALGSTAF